MSWREIPLTRGYVALVDAADYDDLAQFKWHARVVEHLGLVHACRRLPRKGGKQATEFMHRRLLPGAALVDHINGDGLDNRRANLRPATKAENMRNRRGLDANNTSGCRGVYWDKRRGKWAALIGVDGRQRHLGRFTDLEDAAKAFDAAAIELFGEFAGHLNFPEAI